MHCCAPRGFEVHAGSSAVDHVCGPGAGLVGRRQAEAQTNEESSPDEATWEGVLMTVNGWLQILLFLLIVFLVTKPLGVFMTRVFNREKTFMDPVLRPIERLLYRVTRVDESHEMRWTEYAIAMLLFSLVSMIVLYLMQRLQGYLPFNPQK